MDQRASTIFWGFKCSSMCFGLLKEWVMLQSTNNGIPGWNKYVFFQGIHGIRTKVRLQVSVFTFVAEVYNLDLGNKSDKKDSKLIILLITSFPFPARPAVSGLPALERNIKWNKRQKNSSEIFITWNKQQKIVQKYLLKI